MFAVQGASQLALGLDDAQRDVMVLFLELPDASAHRVCPAQVAGDASADQAAGRWGVHAKCQAVVRGCPSAMVRDFHLGEAVCWAAAAHRGARGPFPARQPLAVSQMAVRPAASLRKAGCQEGPQLQAEPVRLPVVEQESQDEWVSVQQAQRASLRPERLRAPALVPWEQSSGLLAR